MFLLISLFWLHGVFAVASEARVCQNSEIGGLPFHLALSSLRNFHAVAVFFHLITFLGYHHSPMITLIAYHHFLMITWASPLSNDYVGITTLPILVVYHHSHMIT